MKNIMIGFVIVSAFLSACNNDSSKTADTKQQEHDDAGTEPHEHPQEDTVAAKSNVVLFPAAEIIAGYLQLKNALAADNTQDAAAVGNSMLSALSKVDKATFSADQVKTYVDIESDVKEHAEHIGKNEGNIAHQREHFEMMSKDIYDLVKAFGSGQVLYKDFCPMYNNNKGAFWISETKEISNPYLGKTMPTCGIIKEEIKQ